MAIEAQVFTLAGVALGALTSYMVSFLGERTRSQRETAKRWEERKFDSFCAYINDVKAMSVIARRITASLGIHDLSPDELSQDEGLPLLTEAENSRTASMEQLRLLADAETISAGHRLNQAVWRLEWFAGGRIADASPERWQQAMRAFIEAFDAFHLCARRELGVPGRQLVRTPEPPPRPDVTQ